MILEEKYRLSNGIGIPKLGFGTWFIGNDDVTGAVKEAAGIGYRHMDTAQAYQNEGGVGKGIRASGVPRDEMFVTTKLAAEIKAYPEAVEAIDRSLKTLGLDHIDLMIIHSPKPWAEFKGTEPYFEGNREVWRALEEAYKAGKLRAIGLSNFQREDIDNILGSCSVKPMVNQILAHIGNTPEALIRYSELNGMLVEAYSPIGHGELMKNRDVAAMAEQYHVSVPQLGIRYCLQLGLLPLPKASSTGHMRNNAAVDFAISPEDMEVLKDREPLKDYGEAARFPVYGGK